MSTPAPRLQAQMKLLYANWSFAKNMTATLCGMCIVQQIPFRLDNSIAEADCLPRELVHSYKLCSLHQESKIDPTNGDEEEVIM